MPINDYKCDMCGHVNEYLVFPSDTDTMRQCEECDYEIDLSMQEPIPAAVAFKIKGLRASNGYGLKFQDSYGVNKVDGRETGYSFTGKGGMTDHNQGQERKVS